MKFNPTKTPQGCVEAYGSHIDLLSEGLDPEHLLGLISPKKTEEESERGIFSYKNLPKIGKKIDIKE